MVLPYVTNDDGAPVFRYPFRSHRM